MRRYETWKEVHTLLIYSESQASIKTQKSNGVSLVWVHFHSVVEGNVAADTKWIENSRNSVRYPIAEITGTIKEWAKNEHLLCFVGNPQDAEFLVELDSVSPKLLSVNEKWTSILGSLRMSSSLL